MSRPFLPPFKRLITCCFLVNISLVNAMFLLPRPLLAHNLNVKTPTNTSVPEEFDLEVYGHTKPTVESQRANYQLRELFGLGTGKQFSGFAFPDTTSNWDAESIDALYNEVLKRQFLEQSIETNDIESPFNSSIGN